MTRFDESNWADRDFTNHYLEAADVIIPERKRFIEILKSFYKHFAGEKKQNRILDLGCGDGILTRELLNIDESILAMLVDGSADMLRKAKERLSAFEKIDFIRASFQDILHAKFQLPNFNLVVSSLAIHHLTMFEKKSLFKYIYFHLNDGGYFLNFDVILAPTEHLETWYLVLWQERIVELQKALKLEDSYEYIIEKYKDNKDNKPDTLNEQLSALKAIGFKEVDCFYKCGIFAAFGGKR